MKNQHVQILLCHKKFIGIDRYSTVFFVADLQTSDNLYISSIYIYCTCIIETGTPKPMEQYCHVSRSITSYGQLAPL